MAFFRCTKCGCEEDTALCNYWSARIQEVPPGMWLELVWRDLR
jgi:hypothetical protein